MSVAKNLEQAKLKIAKAARAAGRDPSSVKLLAVSKTHPVAKILEAYQEGQRLFGENYVQEFLKKSEQLQSQNIEWHFIGRLQSNKVKPLIGKCRLIHSVDRLSLAQEISRRATEAGVVQAILLQVNIGEEASKGGASARDVESLANAVCALPGLKVEGLMAMPPLNVSAEEARRFFHETKKIAAQLNLGPELSMGTSHDCAEAIGEGATIVRVGTDIFGAREEKQ